ncbi:MAG: enoyl-CoA hydratase/isomerase family protein [Bdellovibrionaceae bacterium]|nr:enoyl-CoA hydratase/isomerase family protein [Pseudobdellovibrionaceae bacterium]
MNFKTIKYEVNEGIGVLTINRPEALNALNSELIHELYLFTEELDTASIRVLIVTGAGKAFVAGADINEFKEMSPSHAAALSHRGQSLFTIFEEMPITIIAAVNGFALGGGLELALACDFIIASESAKMGLPEVSLGLIPGYGGTQRLSRNIGKCLARAVVMSGDMFSAQKFYDWGLVVEVTKPEDLMNVAMKWAKTVSKKAPLAVAAAKKAINEGYNSDRRVAMEIEAQLFAECFNTEDQKEGLKAFLEKRSPQFQGK